MATEGVEVFETIERMEILGDIYVYGGLAVEGFNVWPLKYENVRGLEK